MIIYIGSSDCNLNSLELVIICKLFNFIDEELKAERLVLETTLVIRILFLNTTNRGDRFPKGAGIVTTKM
jgi:hypothetical protein